MNNHQRGVYQPLLENVPIYDLTEEEPEDEERSRWPLMIVIGMVVFAAFTGVVWLAYNQGVATGRQGATVVIDAPNGPVRTAPTDAGGGTPYTGLKVYSQPVPPDQEALASALAKPDTPSNLAIVPPAPAPTSEAPPVRLDPGPAAIAAPRPAPAPAAPKPAPAPAATAQAPAKVVQAPPPAPAPAAKSVPAAPPAPAPAVAQVAPAAVPATRTAAASGAVLQIGAYQTQALADGAWNTFKTRYSEVAGNLNEDVQRADLGARGIWYRLRVGPFTDKPSAASACEKLKTLGATCFVTAP